MINNHIKLIFIFICFVTFALNGQIKTSIDLTNPNIISVSIGGNFLIKGTFTVYNNERLDHFLTRLISSSSNEELKKYLELPLRRNITVKRASGKELVVDIEKFYLTGDLSQNPYLEQDDLIIFPAINFENSYIVVDGAVNRKIKFPFFEGDKLSDAILFAQGIDPAYENVKYAEITSVNYSGTEAAWVQIDLSKAEEYLLKRGDIIKVTGTPIERKDYKVLVVGEVAKPGYVYITKNNTTLKSVIEKAGGFKQNAWLEFSEVIRSGTPDKQILKEVLLNNYESNRKIDYSMLEYLKANIDIERLKMFRTANLFEDHNEYLKLDADLAFISKNRLVDFSKLLEKDSEENNFFVKDGDVIFIPEKVELVYVFGQVANPGYYPYKAGAGYNEYITAAGGISESAEGLDETYIIKGNSKNWVKAGIGVTVEPGDYIWLKKNPARSFNFYLTRVSAITGIVGSVATIVLLITQLVK